MWPGLHERQKKAPKTLHFEYKISSVQNYCPSSSAVPWCHLHGTLPWEPTSIELNLFRRKLRVLRTNMKGRTLSLIYKTYGNCPVLKIIVKLIALLLYNIVHTSSRMSFDVYMQFNTGRQTRNKHSSTILAPYCITDCLKNRFFLHSINNWNSLPESILIEPTLQSFISKLEHISPS